LPRPANDQLPCHQAPGEVAVRNFRSRLQAAPLGVMFAWFAGSYFVLTYAIALLDSSARLTLFDALIRLVGASFFGGVMTALVAWQRRRSGGAGTLVQINKAIKTGIVPEDAEPAIWVPALETRRRQNERARWLNPAIFGLFTILGIWLITQEPTDVVLWALIAFFIAIAIFSVIQVPKTVKKIDVILAQLRPAPVDTQSR